MTIDESASADNSPKVFDSVLEEAEAALKQGDGSAAVALLQPILAKADRLTDAGVRLESLPPHLTRALQIAGETAMADRNLLKARGHFDHLARMWEMIAVRADQDGLAQHAAHAHGEVDKARAAAQAATDEFHKLVGAALVRGFTALTHGVSKWVSSSAKPGYKKRRGLKRKHDDEPKL